MDNPLKTIEEIQHRHNRELLDAVGRLSDVRNLTLEQLADQRGGADAIIRRQALELYQLLRRRADQCGMSLEELARRADVSHHSLRHWARGDARPGLRILRRMLAVKPDQQESV